MGRRPETEKAIDPINPVSPVQYRNFNLAEPANSYEEPNNISKKEYPKSLVYDFLKTDLFMELSKQPSLLREQILAQPDGIPE